MINKEESVDPRAEEEQLPGSENEEQSDATSQDEQIPIDQDSIEGLQKALAAMEAKADDHWQRYLRTAAEMENVRKRTVREVEKAHKYGLEKFAGELINVRDSMVMGLDAAKEQATVESLLEGSEITFKLLEQVLSRHGVAQIEPLGQPFDPEFHEAMAMIDAPDAEPNTVVQVVQGGYVLNGRLLRAARVLVAKP